MKVALVALEDIGEALLLRALLENLGADVHLRPVGKPSDFPNAFDAFGSSADFALVSGHGDQGGLVFPEMAPGVDSLVLPNDRLDAALMAEHVRSVPPIVVSTACNTGTDAFAQAFRSAGAHTFIAPADYPEGAAVPILLGLAFHRVFGGQDWSSAVEAANTMFEEGDRFRIWS
ncbi:hypothetical protein [Devosia nitrariae]|uniref:CHAT domain-containing protein n=1 Tax=Devosia nitrariae TaxID=2071872 RepID=A0ABQ5VZC4_9HYPH|nr:hypothetical protein [Devosia nitrariae]GLQ52972.1 hypothetical protein GCM10010862_02300 [Devosia nitrariae]